MKCSILLPNRITQFSGTRERLAGIFNKNWLIVFLLFFTIAGCKKVVEETGTIGICPTVLSTDPASGAINVLTTKKLVATFSEPMDPATINTGTFLLKQGANFVLGTVTYSGVTATFTPASPLSANTVYTATITTGSKDPAKNALIADYVWSFNTGSTPIVVSTDPVNGAVDVSLRKIIRATFSTTMDPLTINSATFIVKNGSVVIPGTLTYSGLIASFTPTIPLDPTTVFTVTITSGAKDALGNAMSANYLWSFATGALPIVVSTDPDNLETNVVLNKAISATFSKNMNGVTITNTTFTLQQGTTQIAGSVTYAGKIAVFTPTNILAINTVYTATITTGVADTSGNNMAANYVWTFKTGSAPVVISTDPANGDLNVPIGKIITASFNTAMDPATITTASFLVKQGTNAVAGTVTYSGTTAKFTPTNPLASNVPFTATITSAVKDALGNNMAANYVWNFSTNSVPIVQSTDPANLATNVVLNKTITATFSKPMDPATINTLTYYLKQGNNLIPATISYTASTASLVPLAPLAANTLYTATVTTGAKDPSGNALAADYTWTFTTSTIPTVLSTDPANGAIDVPLNKVITALFSKAMDPATINALTFTVFQGATQVFGTVTYAGNTASFTPSVLLGDSKVYTATITTGAKDPTGNSIPANYVWNFTTLTSTPPPSILGTAANFGAIGGNAGITNQGLNTVINNGGIGTTAASTLITGFHDGLTGDVYTETPLNVGNSKGGIFTAPPAPGTATSFNIAQKGLADANLAYLAISPASKPGGTDPGAGELGTLTLAPGVYKSASGTFDISKGDLVLDAQGDPNAVWIFQTDAGLTVGSAGSGARSVMIIGNGSPKNVYWYVGSAAVINGSGGGTMVGTIIAKSGITFSTAGVATQTVLNGRALSLVASVTMVNTTINNQ